MAVAGLYRRLLPCPPAVDFSSFEGKTGTGHFSPIGGYHAGKDMALILDVARFKYPPHWVPLPLLWEAMSTIDETTQQSRGFMLISKRHEGPSLLYTLSCKHESWKSISKYLMEQVPQLLKTGGIKSVEKIIFPIFESLPANPTDFIKWIAEVRRLESAEKTVDKEEAERLAIKGEILQQIRATEMYKVVDRWTSSATSCCSLSWSSEADLSEIAKSCCCQGAATLCGMAGVAKECFCKRACMKNMSTCDTVSMAIVSGTVHADGSEQGIDMLVPTASEIKHPPCCNNGESSSANFLQRYPASKDLLTILLLALPPQTWREIEEKELQEEIYRLVSLDNLATGLREEVLHLRRQLHFLYKFQIGKLEEDLQDVATCNDERGY